MAELLIPCAETEGGRVVRAADAVSGQKYICPSCASTLVLRAGDKRQKHFAHPSGGSCSFESVMHQAAKKLIAAVVSENASGEGVAITIEKTCAGCDKKFQALVPDRLFSGSGVEVQVGKFRCDAVAYRGTQVALAFEILVSSPVSKSKSAELNVRWVELEAAAVLQNPYSWHPVRAHLKKELCPECLKIVAIATKWNIPKQLYTVRHDPSASNYVAALETCFKCNEQIPVFWWRGTPFCQEPPPEPRPSTIQWRASKQFGGSYWANTCPSCRSIQGDNHLFVFPSGPLNDLPKSARNMPKEGSGEALDAVIKHMFRHI